MWPQDQEVGTTRNWKTRGMDPPLEAIQRWHGSADTLTVDFWPLELWKNKFLSISKPDQPPLQKLMLQAWKMNCKTNWQLLN